MPMTTEIDDVVYMPEQVIAGFIDTALQMGIKYGQAPHPGFAHVTACTVVLALARHGWPIQTESNAQELAALIGIITEVADLLSVEGDEGCVHVLCEPEPGNPNPTSPALPDDLWSRITKVAYS